jgi:hypothetical protein
LDKIAKECAIYGKRRNAYRDMVMKFEGNRSFRRPR